MATGRRVPAAAGTSQSVRTGVKAGTDGVGVTSSESHVRRTATKRDGRASRWRSCSSAAHAGHPHVPRFMPHEQTCSA